MHCTHDRKPWSRASSQLLSSLQDAHAIHQNKFNYGFIETEDVQDDSSAGGSPNPAVPLAKLQESIRTGPDIAKAAAGGLLVRCVRERAVDLGLARLGAECGGLARRAAGLGRVLVLALLALLAGQVRAVQAAGVRELGHAGGVGTEGLQVRLQAVVRLERGLVLADALEAGHQPLPPRRLAVLLHRDHARHIVRERRRRRWRRRRRSWTRRWCGRRRRWARARADAGVRAGADLRVVRRAVLAVLRARGYGLRLHVHRTIMCTGVLAVLCT